MDDIEFEALRSRLDEAIRQARTLRDKLRASSRAAAAPEAVILPFKSRQNRPVTQPER